MVLKILDAAFSNYFPTQYIVHIIVWILTAVLFRAFFQGRKTNRERDLHGRKIIVTGGFTSTGLTILQALAQRGAHIIALSPHPIDSSEVTILISLLRATFSNEQIYAEHCDLSSPTSIRSFCTRFLTGADQRIDAIIFAHEYRHIGSSAVYSRTNVSQQASSREAASLATFLIITLLLPALLVAPAERDIRIINVVNPFYAAAAGASFTIPFPSSMTTPPSKHIFLQEGIRSLRTSILSRHLQRILDALPHAQVPKTDEGSSTVPVVSQAVQKSNIVAVSVSPGISRMDTIAPLLNADWTSPTGFSFLGLFFYISLQFVLRIFTKSPTSAIQTVLHALFLPTPFKMLSQSAPKATGDKARGTPIDPSVTEMPEEVLKPGALYANCAVVWLNVPVPPDPPASDQKLAKEKKTGLKEDVLEIRNDREFGGEVMGQMVWEAYEDALKKWEEANPAQEEIKEAAPDTDEGS